MPTLKDVAAFFIFPEIPTFARMQVLPDRFLNKIQITDVSPEEFDSPHLPPGN